jgi:hypothetical protein
MLDCKDWEIVLRVYAGHPGLALILAQHLDHLRRSLERGPENVSDVITGLTLGVENLYEHTNFAALGRRLYALALTGDLLPEHEELIEELCLPVTKKNGKQ